MVGLRLALPMAHDLDEADAKRFWVAMRTRFEQFALELLPLQGPYDIGQLRA
jgi:hypothetical protein